MDELKNLDTNEIKEQLRAEVSAAFWNQLVEEMSDKCFNICVKKPGTSLDSYEQRCLSNCHDRLIDAFNGISRAFLSKIQSSG